jgi:hypothetical protein
MLREFDLDGSASVSKDEFIAVLDHKYQQDPVRTAKWVKFLADVPAGRRQPAVARGSKQQISPEQMPAMQMSSGYKQPVQSMESAGQYVGPGLDDFLERIGQPMMQPAVQHSQPVQVNRQMQSGPAAVQLGSPSADTSLWVPVPEVDRDEHWAKTQKVASAALVDLAFEVVDSNGNYRLSRRELRSSPFGETLCKVWKELDEDGDENVSRREWRDFFVGLEVKLGADYPTFVVDMMWMADVDVSHLVPAEAKQAVPERMSMSDRMSAAAEAQPAMSTSLATVAPTGGGGREPARSSWKDRDRDRRALAIQEPSVPDGAAPLPAEKASQLAEAFQRIDKDNDGIINRRELIVALRKNPDIAVWLTHAACTITIV